MTAKLAPEQIVGGITHNHAAEPEELLPFAQKRKSLARCLQKLSRPHRFRDGNHTSLLEVEPNHFAACHFWDEIQARGQTAAIPAPISLN